MPEVDTLDAAQQISKLFAPDALLPSQVQLRRLAISLVLKACFVKPESTSLFSQLIHHSVQLWMWQANLNSGVAPAQSAASLATALVGRWLLRAVRQPTALSAMPHRRLAGVHLARLQTVVAYSHLVDLLTQEH